MTPAPISCHNAAMEAEANPFDKLGPLVPSRGPRTAKIVIIGEAPGKNEIDHMRPFVGASGQELKRMLAEAEIDINECYLTNVFPFRPPSNKLASLCVPRKEVSKSYPYLPIEPGYYMPELIAETCITVLDKDLRSLSPNLIIALGNTALWFFGYKSIGDARGKIFMSPYGKVLPTYHPAMVLRQWEVRPVVCADFLKARMESQFPEMRLPHREIYIEPTFDEAIDFLRGLENSPEISFDIETKFKTITCISLSPKPDLAISVPFFDSRKPSGSYWETPAQELAIWRAVERVLLTAKSRVAQNGLYDIQFLYRMGLRLPSLDQDTMLLHHALFPEMRKGLGFLGSIYTNERSWKRMVRDFGRDK